MDAAELEDMGLAVERTGPLTLFRGSGCTKCRNTGYRGRTAVLEVLSYTDAIRKLTVPDADLEKLRTTARREGMKILRESAVEKMLSGVTTFQEVLRVTRTTGN
jgi:general secretion pathway protein E